MNATTWSRDLPDGPSPLNDGLVAPTRENAEITALELIDHRGVDWSRVKRIAYLVHQYLRYDYQGPIRDLDHRLVIIPPEHYGDQSRIFHRVAVSASNAITQLQRDDFGNHVLQIGVPRVRRTISFEAWIIVERQAGQTSLRLPEEALTDRRLLEPSPLTQVDEALGRAARELAAEGLRGLPLAMRINSWVYRAMHYGHGVTGVSTTAAEAFALKRGVCQDYAHVMLALCRELGLPARYVSGHLIGEGGTHAWVEVLVPVRSGGRVEAEVVALDPTHDRAATLSYVTVALGRDYGDVAPTSGTYRARHAGELSSRRRVALTAVDYEMRTA